MFSNRDIKQIEDRHSSVETVRAQVERFRKGFPWMKIIAPATPGNGIEVLDEKQEDAAINCYESAKIDGKCKFVPASGAASRMFKDLFSGLDTLNGGKDVAEDSPAARFAARICSFAFYDRDLFGTPEDTAASRRDILEKTLTAAGLGYGAKPKGVLKFHRYPDGESRTAIAEHLVEAQDYMRNADGSANLVVTISPEHRQLFEEALAQVKDEYEKRYGVKYNVTFTYQDKATDTIAVDTENKPFRTEDGRLLFRPAGHGALIYNLNSLDEEVVSIKNIDNVCVERMQPVTYHWKKVLMGRALQLRDRIRGYIYAFDQLTAARKDTGMVYIPGTVMNLDDPFATPECQSLCNEIEAFLRDELCIEMPEAKDCRDRAERLRAKLDRPIRVCGMVKNEGEPGGGPFIVRDKDGATSLQILEGAQIDPGNPHAVEALHSATHFNPVDLVCCLLDSEGRKFDLLKHVDEDTGLISSKSYHGRELKALELPGLWNGSMSDWNTLFVEVPIETFNPVKVVLDLLRPAHQA